MKGYRDGEKGQTVLRNQDGKGTVVWEVASIQFASVTQCDTV